MKTTIAHKVMKNSPKVTKRVSSTLDFLILFDHAKSMEETMNTYAYCKNNPIMNIDPNGEFWWIVGAVVGALWAGAESNWDLGKMIEGAVKGAAITLGVEYATAGANWLASNVSVSAKFGYYLETGGSSMELLGASWSAGQGVAWTGVAAGGIYWAGDTVAGLMHSASRENMEAIRLNAQERPYESYTHLADAYIMEKFPHWHYFDDSGNQWGVWNDESSRDKFGLVGDIRWEQNQVSSDYNMVYRMKNETIARDALNTVKDIYYEGSPYSISFGVNPFVQGRNCQTAGRDIYRYYKRMGGE